MPESRSDAALLAKRAAHNEAAKRYYARNRERVKELTRARFKRNMSDPEKREKLRAEGKERTRRYREKYPERVRKLARERAAKWAKEHPLAWRNPQWKRYYGITADDYAAMLSNQNGVCAICASPPKPGKLLNVDHCHTTKAVRGLLCRDCNLAIGHFKELERNMLQGIAYLKSPPGVPRQGEV